MNDSLQQTENTPIHDTEVSIELTKARPSQKSIAVSTNEPHASPHENDGLLTVDVYQNDKEYVVESMIAGVHHEDLEIHITNEAITIRGTRNQSETVPDEDYLYQECFWGRFSRTILLPEAVDPSKSTALLKGGVLTVRMPKIHHDNSKKVKVKVDDEE